MPPFAKATTHPRARRPRARMLTSAFAAAGCSSGPPRRHRARLPERARRHNPKTLNRASLASCFVATGASRLPPSADRAPPFFVSLLADPPAPILREPPGHQEAQAVHAAQEEGGQARTAAQALAEKEQAALNPGGRRGSGVPPRRELNAPKALVRAKRGWVRLPRKHTTRRRLIDDEHTRVGL